MKTEEEVDDALFLEGFLGKAPSEPLPVPDLSSSLVASNPLARYTGTSSNPVNASPSEPPEASPPVPLSAEEDKKQHGFSDALHKGALWAMEGADAVSDIFSPLHPWNLWDFSFDLGKDALRGKIATDNYRHNSLVSPPEDITSDGFIDHQNSDYQNYDFGTWSSDQNGCGWMATYNALQYLGEPEPPEKVIYDLEKTTIANGVFGTNPFLLKNYFEKKGYDVKLSYTLEDSAKNAASSDVNIMTYVSSPALKSIVEKGKFPSITSPQSLGYGHTIMFHPDSPDIPLGTGQTAEKNKTFTFYNEYEQAKSDTMSNFWQRKNPAFYVTLSISKR